MLGHAGGGRRSRSSLAIPLAESSRARPPRLVLRASYSLAECLPALSHHDSYHRSREGDACLHGGGGGRSSHPGSPTVAPGVQPEASASCPPTGQAPPHCRCSPYPPGREIIPGRPYLLVLPLGLLGLFTLGPLQYSPTPPCSTSPLAKRQNDLC